MVWGGRGDSQAQLRDHMLQRLGPQLLALGAVRIQCIRPRSMDFPSWRRHWVDVQTRIAIDTQANFRYVQNLVVEALTPNAPPWRGIVEEGFPLAAIRDERVFFDAVGDDAKFRRNQSAMMDSVSRFLDPDGTDLIRTSEYQLSDASEPSL